MLGRVCELLFYCPEEAEHDVKLNQYLYFICGIVGGCRLVGLCGFSRGPIKMAARHPHAMTESRLVLIQK